ncbi:MAG: O-antigen ligase family protein [Acidaminococcaceae bacterium]
MNALWLQIKPANLADVVFAFLVLLVFVLPFSIPLAGGVFVLTLFLALTESFLQRRQERAALVPRQLLHLLWALVAVTVFSVSQSLNPGASAYNLVYVVGQHVGCFWLVLRYGAQGKRPLLLIKAFLIAGALVACYGVYQYVTDVPMLEQEWVDPAQFPELKKRAFSTLQNPNILGSFLVLVAAYCAGIFAPLRGGKTRIALLVIFAVSCLCLLLTYSRGSWISLFCALFVFAAKFYHKAFIPFIAGGLTVLYIGWDLLARRILSIFTATDTSVALRFSYVESSAWMIWEHPLGVGWYGYRYAFPDYDFYLQNAQVIMYHCHNLYLNVAAELGVVGLFILLAALWQFFKIAWHLARTAQTVWIKGIACGYVAALTGILVNGLTDHTLFNIQLGMLFWLLNGLLLTCAYLERQNIENS